MAITIIQTTLTLHKLHLNLDLVNRSKDLATQKYFDLNGGYYMNSSCKSRVFNIISIIMVSMLILSLGAFANNNKAKADSHSKQLEINVKSDKVPQK